MPHTFSPANHPCMSPLPSSSSNTATEPSVVELGPQTPPCSLLPLALPRAGHCPQLQGQ